MSYPLRFHRVAVTKPWAGSRLRALFPDAAEDFPEGTGESIELADMPGQTSVVANGDWRDKTIREVMAAHRTELMGEFAGAHELPDFPLAIKLLDTSEPLSIQDHPSDVRENGRLVSRGKSECWIVLAADEGAVIYQGLKGDVTREQFETALTHGHPVELLNAREVRAGDYLYNEAGMIHAIGAGLTLLEIQQNCPTTYRLWDFPRAEKREMHLEAGLAAANFELQLPDIQRADGDILLQLDGPFGVRSLRVDSAFKQTKDWPGFTVFTCLEGECEITGRGGNNLQPARMKPGETVLFPAEFTEFEVYPDGTAWLIQCWARE